jgi:hypothetical protein
MTSRDGIAECQEVIELLPDTPGARFRAGGGVRGCGAGRRDCSLIGSEFSAIERKQAARRGVHHCVAPAHPIHAWRRGRAGRRLCVRA